MSTSQIVTELTITLVGIFLGTLAALAVDRANQRRRKRRRREIILRSLAQELNENHTALRDAQPSYNRTPWGKSFYIGTIAWETAMAGGDLPDIIGFELTDGISTQYGLLMRIRYYVDLLTQLWLTPADVPGYEEIRKGFHRAITEAMGQAIRAHPEIMREMDRTLKKA